ncbi:hypothetical protein [Cognatiyoonia koreensis]|nr:hypothetical protein [Cognatiyoonia koreensis]
MSALVAFSIGFATLATTSFGQEGPAIFSLPAGCTAFLTVQSNDCSVDHHFTCEGDPAGHQQRVSLTERGLTYIGSINSETQWVGSYHPFTGHSERLSPVENDPASFTELTITGKDTFDFETLSDEIGTTRYVGQDELTGRTITIDGIDLEETKYQIRALAPDGTELWSAEGNEFISRRWRMFLAGTGTVTTPTDSFEKDDSPVEFIFPGETGFLSANPKHGCGVMLSSFTPLD